MTITFDYSSSKVGIKHTLDFAATVQTDYVSPADLANNPVTRMVTSYKGDDGKMHSYVHDWEGDFYGADISSYLPGDGYVYSANPVNGYAYKLFLDAPDFPDVKDYIKARYPDAASAAAALANYDDAANSWYDQVDNLPVSQAIFTGKSGEYGLFSSDVPITFSSFSSYRSALDGNDKIIGSKYDDVIDGGAGDDDISSGGGKDTVVGGRGNDVIHLRSGTETVNGDETAGLDYQTVADGEHDEVTLDGSADEYTITVSDPQSKSLSTVISKGSDTYNLTGIEKLTFAEGVKNAVKLTNGTLVSETAHQMRDVYNNAIVGTWHRPQAIELDMDPGNTQYEMKDGIYTATGGVFGFRYDAVAAIGIGMVSDGSGDKRVLSVTFKGTNDFLTAELLSVDFFYKTEEYFKLFEPLADSLKSFIAAATGAATIAKVIVSGHSLGGAMTQYLVSELGSIALGYTYGSIGTADKGNAHITNFVNVSDIAETLRAHHDGYRQGGTVWLNASDTGFLRHDKIQYENNVDLLMKYAKDTGSSFSTTSLAKQLLGDGFTKGTIEVAIGTAMDNTIDLRADDIYAIGDGGNDRFLAFTVWDDVREEHIDDNVAGSGGRVINGGSGTDTLILVNKYSDYTRTMSKGDLVITRTSDHKLIATVESSVEYIIYDGEGHKFDGSLVAAKAFSGKSDVTLKGDGVYGKVGNGDQNVAGTAGDDTIITGSGSKSIYGGAGSDYIQVNLETGVSAPAAGSKTDTVLIDGGTGADTMIGGHGNETFIVDNVGDVVIDQGGYDIVRSSVDYQIGNGIEAVTLTGKAVQGAGNDAANIITGTAAANHLYGFGGNDILNGGAGADTLDGGDGSDTASYETAAAAVSVYMEKMASNTGDAKGDSFTSIENLTGSKYNDILFGDAISNTLRGGSGNDTLYGGAGADRLYGGKGNDIFVFKALADSTVPTKGQDIIYDFAKGDRIDLSGIDANSKSSGHQDFAYLGSAKFTGHAGELRVEKHASDTYVYADVNGDKVVDLAIRLDNAYSFSKTDFML